MGPGDKRSPIGGFVLEVQLEDCLARIRCYPVGYVRLIGC